MRNFRQIALFLGLAFFVSSTIAKQLHVDSLRFWTAPDHTRLVFDTSQSPKHKIFLLDNPKRLVIDIKNARLGKKLVQPPKDHSLFSKIRSAARHTRDLRIVVDLKSAVKPKSFSLTPNKSYGHRLVIDLFNKAKKVKVAARKPTKSAKPHKVHKPAKKLAQKKPQARPKPHRRPAKQARQMVVAIDAGHGGEDPGALGLHGGKEKKVVLAIAKKLAAYINKHPSMKAVLIRKGDYYVGLRKRMRLARAAHADLFLSIHADAFKNRKVKGASVYTLSERGASSEAARWLANHENSADLAGGVSLDDKDNVLAQVLLDLSQTASQEASQQIAKKVLKNFGKIGKLHKKSVQKARFMVLKSPDIPSILIETAYISNPDEERKLKSSRHQSKMAKAIYNGVVDYFNLNKAAIMRTAAATQHKISWGETLSGIALHYGVSMGKIRKLNLLASNRIQVGQVLRIPKG